MIYFAQVIDSGPIKIGSTNGCPIARLSSIQTGCPFDLKLIATMEVQDSRAHERYLHDLFKDIRIRGEWFLPHADLLAYIKQHAVTRAERSKIIFLLREGKHKRGVSPLPLRGKADPLNRKMNRAARQLRDHMIRVLYASGVGPKHIAEAFGLSTGPVENAINAYHDIDKAISDYKAGLIGPKVRHHRVSNRLQPGARGLSA